MSMNQLLELEATMREAKSALNGLVDEYSYFRELSDKPNGPDVRKDMFYLSRMIDRQAKLEASEKARKAAVEALESVSRLHSGLADIDRHVVNNALALNAELEVEK